MASILSVEQLQGLAAGSTPNTITIPTGQKIIGTDNASIVAPGQVIQVVHSSINTVETTTSDSFVDTALHVDITPTSSSNKILIRAAVGIYNPTNGSAAAATIKRDSTNLFHSDWGFGYIYTASAGGHVNSIPMETLDSPSTTSQVTYRVQLSRTTVGAGTAYISVNGSVSTITAMEIAQ